MSDREKPKVEIESLSEDDLESVSGGSVLSGVDSIENTGSGTCISSPDNPCTNSGSGTCKPNAA